MICSAITLAAQMQQVSSEEASLATVTRVKAQTASLEVGITNMAWIANEKNDVLLYEIATDKGLTVLLSGSKACQPILAVHSSDGGLYLRKYNELPCGIRFFIDWYKAQVDSCFHKRGVSLYHQNEWDSLINGQLPTTTRLGGVAPLLSSNWMQAGTNDTSIAGYNYSIAGNNQCDHCLAGCVAVAMGQVMYYWKYPVLVKSRETQFDWCNMTDNLYFHSSTFIENRDAVSFLLSECGQSVNMDYGCSSSGAISNDAVTALRDDFGYDIIINYKLRALYSNRDWKTLIISDLNSGRPVIYGGYSNPLATSGHNFVCDGYNERGEFHFNWGWASFYNDPSSFYTLNNLTPSSDHNYNFYQDAIFGIRPAEQQNWCNLTLYLDGFYGEHTSHGHPLYSSTPQTMTRLYSASTSSPTSWRTIPTGATATYRAHEEVVLQDGFIVERGADFTAHIVPCPNCEESRNADIPDEENGTLNETVVIQSRQESIPRETVSIRSEVYPNPTDGEVTVAVDGEVQSIVIYNTTGQPVGGWNIRAITPDHIDLDLSTLPDGHYLICVQTSSGIRTHRVAVAR